VPGGLDARTLRRCLKKRRADLLIASPLGRELLVGYVGYGPEPFDTALSQRLDLGPVQRRVR
jgi:hypothetical protein